MAWTPATLLPLDIYEAGSRFGLPANETGWAASAVLFGIAIAGIFMGSQVALVNKRTYAIGAQIIAIAACMIALATSEFASFIAAKIAIAIAIGVTAACLYGLSPLIPSPERFFGQIAVAMSILFSIVMYLIPISMPRMGPKTVDIYELVLMVIGLIAALAFPDIGARLPVVSDRSHEKRPVNVGILVCAFALYLSQAISYSYSEPAAQRFIFSQEELGLLFMSVSLLQLPAGLFVSWLGERAGLFKPIAAGHGLLMACSFGMYCIDSRVGFIVSMSLLSLGATIVTPYLIAVATKIDSTGRGAAISGSVINLGYAAGPAVASVALKTGGLPVVGWFSAAALVVGLTAICSVFRKTVGTQGILPL
jgi:predicted MFS family arabinose efflux permease